MKSNGKMIYSEQFEQKNDLYEHDIDFFPSIKLERICEIITDETLNDEQRFEMIKNELYIKD